MRVEEPAQGQGRGVRMRRRQMLPTGNAHEDWSRAGDDLPTAATSSLGLPITASGDPAADVAGEAVRLRWHQDPRGASMAVQPLPRFAAGLAEWGPAPATGVGSD